ncbi:MAG: NUDIX domain-containing protein, partial [Spirochaetaceae bacterium]|nr:NUDIX domain-containing protein [Spirochaetaceae bacterium]
MEYWDLYNSKRQRINKLHKRGDDMLKGEYHIVVNVWIKNNENRFIVTQRHPNKPFPLKWECSGGSVVAGEDSFTGALREVEEEIGIKLNPENGKLIFTRQRENDFKDTYLFKEDIKIEDTILQETEVVKIKLVTYDELKEMVETEEIAEPIWEDVKLLG